MNKQKCILVFSGFNQRAIVAFLRTLIAKKVKFAIIAKSMDDEMFLTDYRDKILAVRKSVPLLLDDLLTSINVVKEQIKAEEFIVAPSTEALNRFLLENRESFEQIGCSIPLVEKELYESISDKYDFGNICRKYQITVPKEFELCKNNSLPIAAKPKKYYSPINKQILSPVIIKNSSELEIFTQKYHIEDFYFQEYVFGKSLYLLYYFHRNGTVYKFSQENLIQQTGGKSIVAATVSDFHKSIESDKYVRLFKDLSFFGLVMVEVKQYMGKNFMIEANPRFWGPSQLFVDAGMNLFEAFLNDLGFLETIQMPEEPIYPVKYFWFGGVRNFITDLDKMVFYNYNPKAFMKEFCALLKNEIYLRADTSNLYPKDVFYLKEAKQVGKR